MFDDAINTIMNGDFITGIFQLLMSVLITIVNIILYPFSILITSLMPGVSDALVALAGYFDLAGTYMAWVINAFAIPPLAITLIVAYYFFAYTSTFTVWVVKLTLRWKSAIWG